MRASSSSPRCRQGLHSGRGAGAGHPPGGAPLLPVCGPSRTRLLATVPLKQLHTAYQVAGHDALGPHPGHVARWRRRSAWTLEYARPRPTAQPLTSTSRSRPRFASPASTPASLISAPRAAPQLVTARFADCWSRVSNIRVYKDNPTTQPWFQELELTGDLAAPACTPDAYFAVLADTADGLSVYRLRYRSTGMVSRPRGASPSLRSEHQRRRSYPPNRAERKPQRRLDNALGTAQQHDRPERRHTELVRSLDLEQLPGRKSEGDRDPVHSLYLNNDSNAQILDLVRTSGTGQLSGGSRVPNCTGSGHRRALRQPPSIRRSGSSRRSTSASARAASQRPAEQPVARLRTQHRRTGPRVPDVSTRAATLGTPRTSTQAPHGGSRAASPAARLMSEHSGHQDAAEQRWERVAMCSQSLVHLVQA